MKKLPMLLLLALTPLLLAPTPAPIPQKRVEGIDPVSVINDGGAYGISVRVPAVVNNGGVTVTYDGGSYGISVNSITDAGFPVQFSIAPELYYVDAALGSDSTACTSTGAAACATMQSALNRAAKARRHQLTVTAACGNYSGFYVSGFSADVAFQQASSGISLQGSMLTVADLASGNATGTATSGVAGAHAVFGTLTDTTQDWTTNDLQGRYLTLTGGAGAGQTIPISSNTTTEITIVYRFSPMPDATTTYAIQEPCSVLNTAISGPGTPAGGAIANSMTVLIAGNSMDYGPNTTSIEMKNFKFTAASSSGISIRTGSAVQLTNLMFVPGSATNIRINGSLGGSPISMSGISSLTASTTLTHVSLASSAGSSNMVAMFLQRGGIGLKLVGDIGGSSGFVAAGVETVDTQIAPFAVAGTSFSTDGSRADCAAGVTGNSGHVFGSPVSSLAFLVAAQGTSKPAFGSIDRAQTTDCDHAVTVLGGSKAYIFEAGTLTGTATSSVFDVRSGGQMDFTNAMNVTGAAAEVRLDGQPADSFATMIAGACTASLNSGSRVCKR